MEGVTRFFAAAIIRGSIGSVAEDRSVMSKEIKHQNRKCEGVQRLCKQINHQLQIQYITGKRRKLQKL